MAIRFSKLTRPNIRALKVGQSITEHGITLRRDANGDGVFSVNIMVDRQRIPKIGSASWLRPRSDNTPHSSSYSGDTSGAVGHRFANCPADFRS